MANPPFEEIKILRERVDELEKQVRACKEIEEKLKEREQLLNDMGSIGKIGGWEMDLASGKAVWTRGTYDIVGIAYDKPIPGFYEHVAYYLPEYRAMVQAAMEELIQTKKPMQFEAPALTAQGTVKWFKAIGEVVVENGFVVKLRGTLQDITERKNAEASLRQSEEKYLSIMDNISIGVALIGPDMEILSLNKQMKKWNPQVDLKEKHICYRSFNNPPREKICSYCPTAKTLKDGLVHEDVTETPMGGHVLNYRVISSPIKDETGRVIAAIEMVEDITEKKKLEREARKRTQDLEVFYKASVGREERILELKKEIERLKRQ